jgi:hypothetical protein
MTVGAANETPVRQDQGSVAASNDNDSLLATPEMDGASFQALMKERTRVSRSKSEGGVVWWLFVCCLLASSLFSLQC